MASGIRRIEYFRTTVKDQPGAAYTVLSALSSQGVNLLAFTAIPTAVNETQLILFPDSSTSFAHAANAMRMSVDGPHAALLVQGDDALGAIAEIHGILADDGINVLGASGVADGRGTFGYVIHLRESDVDRAAHMLRQAFAVTA